MRRFPHAAALTVHSTWMESLTKIAISKLSWFCLFVPVTALNLLFLLTRVDQRSAEPVVKTCKFSNIIYYLWQSHFICFSLGEIHSGDVWQSRHTRRTGEWADGDLEKTLAHFPCSL